MPSRRISLAGGLRDGVLSVLRDAGVDGAFTAPVTEEAEAAALLAPSASVSDLPFVTIDPPGSRDLDQALHIARAGDGYRVSYAIADVGAFVTPGGLVDAEAHARGVTVYAPDAKA